MQDYTDAVDYADGESEDFEEKEEESAISRLQQFLEASNVAEELDEEELNKISKEVCEGYEIDKASRSEWDKLTSMSMDLALQVHEEKSFPWANAANVKYPLITVAAMQFAARAYPEIIQGGEVVKGRVIGKDPDGMKQAKADRIGAHMSYQLLEEDEVWEEDTDKLLLNLAIVGCNFRKTYFDPVKGHNCSKLVHAKNFYVNHNAESFDACHRKTECFSLYKNEIIENQRAEYYLDIELPLTNIDGDSDCAYEFLEQHCWFDLDEDGYREPYVVTLHLESKKVLRIAPRFSAEDVTINNANEIVKIKATEYYTKYGLIPNPDGGIYDIGLGILNPLNETVNSILNQLLDAGTAQNMGGGFIGSGLRLKGGAMRFAPGEYKVVDPKGGNIRDNIVPLPMPGPSPVLFQLLGLLIEAGKDIASVKDVLTGEGRGANESPTTTLALIEQGLKSFSAIMKRIYRSLKQEVKKLYQLNKLYLDPENYIAILDVPVNQSDYAGDDTDVIPVLDPAQVTDAQELVKAQALLQFLGNPNVNQQEILIRYFKAMKEDTPESLLAEPPKGPPPELMLKTDELRIKDEELDIKRTEVEIKARESQAKTDNMNAQTMEIVGNLQMMGNQIQQLMQVVNNMSDAMQQQDQMIQAMRNENGNNPGRNGFMEGQPDNPEGDAVPSGLPGGDEGEISGGMLSGQEGLPVSNPEMPVA